MKAFLLFALPATLILSGTNQSTASDQASAVQTNAPDHIERLINAERRHAGLKPLTSNVQLDESACAEAEHINRHHY